MKLYLILFLLYFQSSEQLIPTTLNNLIGSEEKVEEYTKFKTELYKSYRTLNDSKGVYAIQFELKNPNKLIDYLQENKFEKVYDVEKQYYHLLVFTNQRYQIKIFKNSRTAIIYDFEKRKLAYQNDDFYGETQISSLRFEAFQESQFSPSIELKFIPNDKYIKCKVHFTGPNWIYSKTIKFSFDDGNKILIYPLEEISRDVKQGRFDIEINEVSTFLIPIEEAKFYNVRNIKVRIVGDKYYEFPLTDSMKYAIQDLANDS